MFINSGIPGTNASNLTCGSWTKFPIAAYLNVVIPYPTQGIIELWVNTLEILHGEFLAEHPLVEGHRKARVDELAVVESHGDETPDEFEVS